MTIVLPANSWDLAVFPLSSWLRDTKALLCDPLFSSFIATEPQMQQHLYNFSESAAVIAKNKDF